MCYFFTWSRFLFRQSIKESGISSRETKLVFRFLDDLRLCNTICCTWGGGNTGSGWRRKPGRWPHQKDCGQVRDQREIHQTGRARASPSEWTRAKDARCPWRSAGPRGKPADLEQAVAAGRICWDLVTGAVSFPFLLVQTQPHSQRDQPPEEGRGREFHTGVCRQRGKWNCIPLLTGNYSLQRQSPGGLSPELILFLSPGWQLPQDRDNGCW